LIICKLVLNQYGRNIYLDTPIDLYSYC